MTVTRNTTLAELQTLTRTVSETGRGGEVVQARLIRSAEQSMRAEGYTLDRAAFVAGLNTPAK